MHAVGMGRFRGGKRASSLDRSSISKTPKVDYTIPTRNTFSALALKTPTQPATPKKPSPITVTDKANIDALLKRSNFPYRLKLVSIGTKIYVETQENFNSTCNELREQNIQFYSHPFGDDKTFKLILSGLPETPVGEITNYLKSHNNVTVNKIIMLTSTGPYKRYLLHFNPNENSKEDVKGVKYVMNHVIKWLPVKRNHRGPSQCLRCAMFGHGISACDRKPTCFLCGEQHETKTCKFDPQDNGEKYVYKCNNCKANNLQHNHKANDPSCPSRSKYIEIKSLTSGNTKKAQQQPQYQHAIANFPPLHKTQPTAPRPLVHTFAHAAKSNAIQNNANNVTSQNGTDELFTFAELSNILFSCINELEKCTNKYDQLKVIANLLSNVCK